MSVDLLNRALRPLTVYALMFCGVVFLLGLGVIMLFRYANFGEIDWQGLVAFLGFITTFGVQHFQNRHQIKRDQVLINTPPLTNAATA